MPNGSRVRAAGPVAAVGIAVAVAAVCLRGDPEPVPAAPPVLTPVAVAPATQVWTAPTLVAPRCVRVDAARERVFVCGTDGGLHVFDCAGRHLRSFPLPGERDGNPQGLAVDADGNVLVADTHAFRVLRVSPDGAVLGSYGRRGDGAGEFHWPTGVCEAPDRTLWVTEYGQTFDGNHDRLHHLQADGTPIAVFGGTGSEPGRFYRPSNVTVGPEGHVWVADACNHRVQVLDATGAVRQVLDGAGSPDGALRNPYDLWFADGVLFVAEFGASRIRRWPLDGTPIRAIVLPGRELGAVATPWGLTLAHGALYVADTGNKRLQVWASVPDHGDIRVARADEGSRR